MSKKGLGITDRPSTIISPCPGMINQYFRHQLNYDVVPMKNKNGSVVSDPYLVKYTKTLNHPDCPLFPELAYIDCLSTIVVDMYTGRIIDHYFKINNGPAIRAYQECPSLKTLQWVFKWHINLVHMSREYIKGGWLLRDRVKKEIETTKDKYTILNKTGLTNLLEKAKPEPLGLGVE